MSVDNTSLYSNLPNAAAMREAITKVAGVSTRHKVNLNANACKFVFLTNNLIETGHPR